ncbi:endonuclease domain-containing protein [Flavobacterium branchiicola]|uniref:Endonuclease domain-containing protein n=1 Tax=Flavobacterium branchiicola TaxID=1114875 RepID=A0ABV9PH56_9FLAO|nr:DUF559 domain-containing protein [Flavobacterium branchiicola]MBS7255984.1 DUF559 domain-containing protein [Flavobacterium branchiicola]
MLDKNILIILQKSLESKESFEPLLDFFVQMSIVETKLKEKQPKYEYNYSNFYSRFLDNYSKTNSNLIFENCQSPIERMFISSLLLLFVKNGILGFTITPKIPDIESTMKIYRDNHKKMLKIVESYKVKTGDLNLINFELSFRKTFISSGIYTEDDYEEICWHYYIVRNFTLDFYYVTLQPEFPNLKIDNKSIRPDILIWCPGNEKLKLIIECDGFQFHNSKKSFINDRKRDRLLKMNGYDVIRYSGTEIFTDPAGVSEDLYKYIRKTWALNQ